MCDVPADRSRVAATSPPFQVRAATAADIPVIASQRAAMFRDMGKLASGSEAELISATADYLRSALARGEYLGWVAESCRVRAELIGGAGVQLRPILPRPRSSDHGIELGPEAIVLNVYVMPEWRRRGVGEALMRSLLTALKQRNVRRIVLHAADDGRRLYERLGFVPTNEMRLETE
jgi:GNAT superfamily N-acetyltransferase